MKLIDVSVPLDSALPTYPGINGMVCLPLPIKRSGGARARVILRGS
jgi:kynurenine formamidase